MGHCLSKTTIIKKEPQEYEPFAPVSNIKNDLNSFHIQMAQDEKSILFKNAPLINNNFLFDKFHHETNIVEKIDLEWKVLSLTNEGSQLKIGMISLVTVRMWVVIGGQETKTITGVYTKISDYDFADFLLIQEQKHNAQTKFICIKVPKLSKHSKIRIILESVANKNQSIWLINSYLLSKSDQIKLERQQLMWNNLAFQIQNIYNQNHSNEQQFIESDIECIICTEQSASCIILPCKHMCIGKNCLENFRKSCKFCPLCKKQFNQLIIC